MVVIPKYLFNSYAAFDHSDFVSGQYSITDVRSEDTTNKLYVNICLFKRNIEARLDFL